MNDTTVEEEWRRTEKERMKAAVRVDDGIGYVHIFLMPFEDL